MKQRMTYFQAMSLTWQKGKAILSLSTLALVGFTLFIFWVPIAGHRPSIYDVLESTLLHKFVAFWFALGLGFFLLHAFVIKNENFRYPDD